MTNLLPLERQKVLLRDYMMRFCVVSIWLLTALIAAAAVLLLPTYVLVTGSTEAKKARLANIEMGLSSSDEATLSARLVALSSGAEVLAALGNIPSVSGILNKALAVPRPGVTLSGFAYKPATATGPGTLAVSGRAATRTALSEYQLALRSAPFARSASLPVSAYAQDTDIMFTITVTLAPPGAGLVP